MESIVYTYQSAGDQKSLLIHLSKALHSLSLTFLSNMDVYCVPSGYKSSSCNFLSDTFSSQYRERKVIFQDSALTVFPNRCLHPSWPKRWFLTPVHWVLKALVIYFCFRIYCIAFNFLFITPTHHCGAPKWTLYLSHPFHMLYSWQ